MASGNITGATHDLWLPEIWSPEVQLATKNKLVIAPHVDRRWDKPNLRRGDIIRVPTVTNLTIRQKGEGDGSPVTFEYQSEGTTVITIDQHWYSAVRIEDIAELQTDVNLRSVYTQELAYPIALKVDDVLAGLFDNFSANTVGSAGTPLSEDQVMECYQKLLEADAEVTPATCAWIISPAEFTNLIKNDNFIDRNKATNMFGDIPGGRGFVGVLMNASVFVTNNCDVQGTGTDETLMHFEALALVMSRVPRLQTDYDINHLADVVVVDIVYGTQKMRDTFGVFISGA